MATLTPTYRFRSELFAVEPLEDEATNPFCYGRSVALWLQQQFAALGYEVEEEVIADDWGWVVMLSRKPFMLWVGCGNEQSGPFFDASPAQDGGFVPAPGEITWHCFVGTDVMVWTPFFWRRLVGLASTRAREHMVARQLEQMLRREPGIRLLDGEDDSEGDFDSDLDSESETAPT